MPFRSIVPCVCVKMVILEIENKNCKKENKSKELMSSGLILFNEFNNVIQLSNQDIHSFIQKFLFFFLFFDFQKDFTANRKYLNNFKVQKNKAHEYKKKLNQKNNNEKKRREKKK